MIGENKIENFQHWQNTASVSVFRCCAAEETLMVLQRLAMEWSTSFKNIFTTKTRAMGKMKELFEWNQLSNLFNSIYSIPKIKTTRSSECILPLRRWPKNTIFSQKSFIQLASQLRRQVNSAIVSNDIHELHHGSTVRKHGSLHSVLLSLLLVVSRRKIILWRGESIRWWKNG